MKKNLDQIRAINAFDTARQRISGKEGGEVIKKVPPLILNHGLLAVGAYAFDEKTGFKAVVDAIARHLSHPAIALVPAECTTTDTLMRYLNEKADSDQLRCCTTEALAWLEYARRYIKRDKGEDRS